MGKSGGASRRSGVSSKAMRSVRERASRSSSGGGARSAKATKTPEQAHAEKVARAEESVRKAQARVDANRQRVEELRQATRDPIQKAYAGLYLAPQHFKDDRALLRAQTRLANLRAANPSQTPAQRAHAAKSAQYEAKIAKARESLAKLEAEYAAHQRGETVTPARSSTRGAASARPAAPQPIKGPDLDRYSPYGRLNPYDLATHFGRGQLRAVLSGATPRRLRDAVDVVQERNPGTKPASRSRKADMIDYIDRYVP